VIVEQGPNIEPCIVIQAEEYVESAYYDLADYLHSQVRDKKSETFTNEWPPK
jgi:hypothetical protein